MKNRVYIFMLSIFCTSFVFANEYEDWLKNQNSAFHQYKKTIDEEFSNMLKKDWQNFKTMNEANTYEKPKPKKVPQIKQEPTVSKNIIEKSKPVTIQKIEVAKLPKIKKQEQKNIQNKITVDFFNQMLVFEKNNKLHAIKLKISKESISDFWDKISKSNYKIFIENMKNYKNKYDLNDWAMYLLIYKYAHQQVDINKSNLFTWFILSKMGYDTKVGYTNDNIYLLSTIKQKLYQVSFFTFNGSRYYIMNPKGRIGNIGSIFTYKGSYPNAKEKLNFDMSKKAIRLYTNLQSKKLEFKYKNKFYSFNTQYSKDLIEFYKTFPQSEYTLYFNAQKSQYINNILLKELAEKMKNMKEVQAINFLLRFVQKSFKYKKDDEQFAHEKVMFLEETIYYPYSDCEDRSIIFSYLVENLLGLEVIGVKFKNHLATAVNISTPTDGDTVIFQNKSYTIADPTYINANLGMTMPQYKNKTFELIP